MFKLSATDEFGFNYPTKEMVARREALEMLDHLAYSMDQASGSRYYELVSQYEDLREQLQM